ncbi:MAG: class I SAM-dependent RNA methyltransferase [Anaerolineales bacterium]|nr:class I SAM-dependent RNA methyltransferase [Anaerolineales bacterium]
MANAEENVTLTIEGFAYGGDAFGRSEDGRMIFVAHAAPGERVTCNIIEDHAHWAKATLVDVLQPIAKRVAPRCPHYGACGGCHYQFLPYKAQLEAKTNIVRSQMQRIAKIEHPPVNNIIPSPSPWNMRNQLQFHQNAEGWLGFHRAGSHEVLPVQTCLLPHESIAELWPRAELEYIPGLRRIAFRSDSAENAMIVFHAKKPAEIEMRMDAPASVAWASPAGTQILGGDDHLFYSVREREFVVSPASFFQVNNALTEKMVEVVFNFLQIKSGEIVFDLYSGVGLFAAFAAEQGAAITAAEVSSSACEDFAINLDAFDHVEMYQAQTSVALEAITKKPNAIIMDPPRSGLSSEVRDALIRIRPRRMAYISCDTATFARDARHLIEGGFKLHTIQPMDLFPQTYHIELISLWEKPDV